VLEKQGTGFLTGSPAYDVEHKRSGYEKWTDEVLRQGVRNFIAKYRQIRPMIINLGNEPSNKGDDAVRVVHAYKVIYEEVKKIDPSIIVVGTSVGANEDFFKAGLHGASRPRYRKRARRRIRRVAAVVNRTPADAGSGTVVRRMSLPPVAVPNSALAR
jgi:hypothetical protein